MTVCLAESLIECRGFSARDQLERYLRWYKEGRHSANGECFDIGVGTRVALEAFAADPEHHHQSDDRTRAGNGSLMRTAPIPLLFRTSPALAIERGTTTSVSS